MTKRKILSLTMTLLMISLTIWISIMGRNDPFNRVAFPTSGKVNENEMDKTEKQEIQTFYEVSPELISKGKNFDFKYAGFNPYEEYHENLIQIVFKGEEYIELELVEIEYCQLETNSCKNEIQTVNNPIIPTNSYFPQNNIRFTRFYLNKWLGDSFVVDPPNYTFQTVSITLYYNQEKETHKLFADLDAIMNLYKPTIDLDKAIEDYPKFKKELKTEEYQYIGNYKYMYFIDKEKYMNDLLYITKLVEESGDKEELLRDFEFFRLYVPILYTDDKEVAEMFYNNMKPLYEDIIVDEDQETTLQMFIRTAEGIINGEEDEK